MDTAKLNGPKRAVIYARVSTDEQANKGYSLESQIEACGKYAHAHELEITGGRYFDTKVKALVDGPNDSTLPVRCFVDDYTGTVPIESRPEGYKAYEMLRSNQADVLIAYRIDRIVRPPEEGDEWDMPILIRGLARLGKEIHTLDRGQLKTDFASLLIAMLDAKGAGDERRKITERTTRGRMAKLQSQQVVGNGIFPYGYHKTGQGPSAGIEIDEAEARIVRLIFEWYVSGDEYTAPLSFNAIAKRLTERQIETPGASRAHRKIRTRLSYAWDYGTVSYILKNPIYMGQWHWAKAVIPVPLVVSQALWDEAQKRREYNRKLSQYNKSRNYLLAGMITCHCGLAMVGTSSPAGREKDRWYYECTSKKRHHKGIEEFCPQPLVRADRVETAVWCYILNLLTDPETFETELRKAQRAEQDKVRPLHVQLEHTLELINEVEHQANELGRALGKVGGIVGQTIEAQVMEINQRHAQLCHTRDRLQSDIEKEALSDRDIDHVLSFRNDVIEGLQSVTAQDMREIFKLLRVRAVLDGQQVNVTCCVPVGAEPLNIDLKTSKSTPGI